MDSISLTVALGLRGRALGTTANSSLQSPIASAVNASFSSTLTGGSKITNGMKPPTQTLAASANTTYDLRSFTNLMGEASHSVSKVRYFLIYHLPTSLATTGIRVGNAASNAWTPFGMTGTSTDTLLPGDFIIKGSTSTTGMTASGTNRNIKVENLDSGQVASFRIEQFGDT